MIKNYFKIAWRSLWKNKLYSFINVGGLAIGMAVSFILLLYVYNEFSFDQYHQNKDRLYRVWRNQPASGEINTNSATPLQLAGVLQKDYPEIEKAARVNGLGKTLLSYDHKALKFDLIAADPSLLDMFTVPFVHGDRQHAFTELASIIIAQSTAKALFGDKDPVGQVIKLSNLRLAKVSAVYKDFPVNSSFQFKGLISWDFFAQGEGWIKESGWGNYSFRTYVMTKPGVDVDKLNVKVKKLIAHYDPYNKENEIFLFPYTRAHLHGEFKNGVNTGGSIEYVRLFLFLAIGILIIACINFMNLSTARSEKRSREVGVRKVVGAGRLSIIQQFLGESMLMAFLALVIAFLLVITLLPYFNTLINQNLKIDYKNIGMWVSALAVTIFTGIIAGSYPALFLSSFKPVKVLKGINNAGKRTLRPRQILVITQFTFATSLILCSILIYKQITFIKQKPVGYDQKGLIEMDIEGVMNKSFENFRRDAIDAGAITDGALTSGSIVNNGSSSWGVEWPGQLPGENKIPIDQIVGTYHLTSTYGMHLVQGRDFSISRPADSSAILLNESAVKLMRLKDPLGKIVKWQGENRTVVGVVKDFVWGSPYEPVKPAIVGFNKGWQGGIALRLNANKSVSESLALLQQIYKKYNPDYTFEYNFVDEEFEGKFQTEQLLGTLSTWFTGLAIFISCLGLFGLSAFAAEQRKKEIGVRKVLGASVKDLWFNLSKEFIALVIVSFVIGASISWYYMSQWLQHYTYRTGINVWVFVATIAVSLILCVVTVSFQAIKAALANPVKSLRTE